MFFQQHKKEHQITSLRNEGIGLGRNCAESTFVCSVRESIDPGLYQSLHWRTQPCPVCISIAFFFHLLLLLSLQQSAKDHNHKQSSLTLKCRTPSQTTYKTGEEGGRGSRTCDSEFERSCFTYPVAWYSSASFGLLWSWEGDLCLFLWLGCVCVCVCVCVCACMPSCSVVSDSLWPYGL